MFVRLEVHRAQLPDLPAILDARKKAPGLFLLAHFEPVLNENDTRLDDRPLPGRTEFEKSGNLPLRAESHHSLYSCAVVPTTVEYDHFACSRKVRKVTLHIHLGFLSFGRSRQRHNPEHSGADSFSDTLDDTALACSVAPFEDHNDLDPLVLHP